MEGIDNGNLRLLLLAELLEEGVFVDVDGGHAGLESSILKPGLGMRKGWIGFKLALYVAKPQSLFFQCCAADLEVVNF